MVLRQAPAALLLLATLIAAPAVRAAEAPGEPRKSEAAHKSDETRRLEEVRRDGLPPEAATQHVATIGEEKIAFTARAGAIRLRDAATEAPQADVAVVSYERNGVDAATRPVLFVFNGGPGAASAWLGLGAVSPWRLRMTAEALSPSAPLNVVDNAESWLPFADLVLIDPPGTGVSKLLTDSEDARKHFFSADGDAQAMAVVIRKWLTARGRLGAPKYLLGESYGGIRCVKLLEALRQRENVGVSGLILVSPALDMSWYEVERNPLARAALLPSFAAIARGATDRAAVADAESYAAGDFLTDYLKGPQDAPALSRMSARIAALAGLDPALVARLGARLDAHAFAREKRRDAGRVLSVYDGAVSGEDPSPFAPDGEWADPMLESWRAPLGAAMTRLLLDRLSWPIGDARYGMLSGDVSHRWDWGQGGSHGAEVMSELRAALALDTRLTLLVMHGLYDMVTPYFATKLMLDQLPFDPARQRLLALRGGHMPYLYDDARKAMRDAARGFLQRP